MSPLTSAAIPADQRPALLAARALTRVPAHALMVRCQRHEAVRRLSQPCHKPSYAGADGTEGRGSRSRADANRRPAQVRYAHGRWWTALRSPRKRVRGQPLRGFKSHLHRRWPARTPVLTAGRRARRGPLGLIWWSQLGAACGPIAGLSRSCRAWSPPSRTTLNTSTHAAESCTWRFTEPAALPRPGISAMPVWPAAGSAAARRLPFLRPSAKGSNGSSG